MNMERNAPCYCGSGRKYKKCCLARDEADAAMRVAEAKQQAEAEIEEERRVRRVRRVREEALAARQQARESVPFGTSDDGYDDDDDAPAASTPGPPPLPEEDQQLVDAWWEEVSPVYMSKDGLARADWLLERTVAFLDEHPRLFPHLDLQDEFLIDVGSTLNRAGLMAGHHALLLRLRDEQPEVYAECFGFFDSELLAEALRDGRRNDIPACLALFRQDPLRFIDQLADVVDLLAWQGCESELRGLLEATAKTIFESEKIFNGGLGMRWLVNLGIFPTLELGDTSADSLEELLGLDRQSPQAGDSGRQKRPESRRQSHLPRHLRPRRRPFAHLSGTNIVRISSASGRSRWCQRSRHSTISRNIWLPAIGSTPRAPSNSKALQQGILKSSASRLARTALPIASIQPSRRSSAERINHIPGGRLSRDQPAVLEAAEVTGGSLLHLELGLKNVQLPVRLNTPRRPIKNASFVLPEISGIQEIRPT